MVTPDPMLPPESAPWGRYVSKALEDAQRDTNKNNGDITNALKGLNSTVTRISKQISDLNALTQELAEQQTALVAQQGAIVSQQNYLSSLISRDAFIPSFNTGTLTNDSVFRFVGDEVVIANMPVSTGKVRITINTSECSINSGGNAVIGGIVFGVDGVLPIVPDSNIARLYAPTISVGCALTRIGTVIVPPGNHTFRARCSYWSAGANVASINFTTLRLLVEVINSD